MTIPTALRRQKSLVAALLIKSDLLLSEGKVDEAVRIARTATESHPDSPTAFSAVSRAQRARRDVAAATATFQEAIRVNPLATDAKIALARLALAFGRAASSTAHLTRASDGAADARAVLKTVGGRFSRMLARWHCALSRCSLLRSGESKI